jgi:hypothetical protein
MANYQELKDAVAAVIRTNGNQEITGQVLQNTLQTIISTIGSNRTFVGIATPTTAPGTTDANVFYLAATPGVYANFNGVELKEKALIFYNDASGNWRNMVLSVPTSQQLYMIGAEQSFYQNKALDNEDRARWISAFKDVKIVFSGAKPLDYPNTQIAVSLVRRKSTTDHELRFKIKENGKWEYIGYQPLWEDTNSPENPNGGATLYEKTFGYGSGFIHISCWIDWNIFGVGSSIFVDGAFDAEPYYILSQDNMYLTDVNVFEPENVDLEPYQKNVFGKSVKTFVPDCSFSAGNILRNVIVLTTPYKFSDSLNFSFEIGWKTASPGKVGYKTLTLSFWARNNNTFNYYTPFYFWSDKRILTPVRLCINSDGCICIAIGTDGESLSNTIGTNLIVYVKKVGINMSVSPIPKLEGWSFKQLDELTPDYTNVFYAENGVYEDKENGYMVKPSPLSIVTTFTPLVAYSLGPKPGEYKIRINLPSQFIPNMNARMKATIRVADIQYRGLGYSEATIEFWGRKNGIPQYGVVYADARFPFRLRAALDGNRYAILLDGNFSSNSVVTIPEFSIYSNVKVTGDISSDFQFVPFTEDELPEFTGVYEPTVYKTATTDYVDDRINNIQSVVQPIKPKSYAIFGSSKSTTRNAYSGYLRYLVKGLLTAANYTDILKTTGAVHNRPYNGKAFTNTADGIIGKKIKDVGSTMEFSVYGSHVNIIQLIERTTDYAEFDIYDNGKKIGTYNNRNKTMFGEKTQIFNGDGSQKSFVLDFLDCYNFNVMVNGVVKNVSNNPQLTGGDCYAVRTIMTFAPYDDGQPRRILYFPEAPEAGAVINVTYSVGQVIGFIQSDYSESDNGTTENVNPVSISSLTATATYRNGYPLSPVVNNPDAVLRISFDGYGMHVVKIEITGGENPYFDFDFACAEINDFMNAAFGGYDLLRAISETQWHDWRCVRYLPYFDNLILEYGTNDDRYEIDRVLVREQTFDLEELKGVKMKDVVYINNQDNMSFATGLCTGTIQEITPFSIKSDDIKTSEIEVGDYMKIGEYHSDWREFTIRRVKTVDKGTGIVTWDLPFSVTEIWHYRNLSEMIGAQFSVRRLGQVKKNYKTLCDKFKVSNPNAKMLIIGMSAFNNNDYCSGWGYNEAQQDIANEYNGIFVNISDEQIRFNDGALSSENSVEINIPSTGAADYEVAGETIGNVNRAMRIIVNGNDVTGIDAYIERTDGWYINNDVEPSLIKLAKGDNWGKVTLFSTDYNSNPAAKPVKIHFYNNVPSTDDEIKLLVGGYGWSDDGVHQTDKGNQTYGSCILKAITQ